jgi:septal ring factor EnvC (AmiA/AmiB activator)
MHRLLSLVPSTWLGRTGWFFEFSFLLIGLGVFIRFLLQDWQERGTFSYRGESSANGSDLPDAEALRNRGAETTAKYQHRPILYQLLRTLYSRLGYIQEEEVTATLEESILSRAEILRELAALAILTALFFTFLTLYYELRAPTSQDITGRLAAVFDLVGVNWPGILAGLLCAALAGVVRYRNAGLLKYYRNWLDADIFPKLGAARTTVDQLGSLTTELKGAVEKLTQGLQPLAQLPTVLNRFQTDVIGGLIPKLVEGLQRVPVSLSDATVRQLRKISGDSSELLARITRDYGKLVLLSEQSGERQAEIASGITSAAGSLRDLNGPVDAVASALTDNSKAVISSSAELAGLAAELNRTTEHLPKLTATAEQLGNQVKELGRPLEEATQAANTVHSDLVGAGVRVERLTERMNAVAYYAQELGGVVSHMLGELRAFSGRMEALATALVTALGSVESTVGTRTADLNSVSKAAIDEAKTFRTTVEALHQGIATARDSLIKSAKELFDQAAQAREAEKKTVVDAGSALENATKSLERNVAEAARVLADSLTQTGEIAKKQEELESKVDRVGSDVADCVSQTGKIAKQQGELESQVNKVESEVAKLDHDTRGRGLFRRLYRGED